METITAKDAHLHLGEVLNDSQQNPIAISKNGKPFSVMVSAKDFNALGGAEAVEALRLRQQIDLQLARSEEAGGEISHNDAIAGLKSKFGG